jgi:hypothetical protein
MKQTYLLILFFLLNNFVFSQIEYFEQPDNKTDTAKERNFFYGINLNLTFGTFTYISLSPKIAVPITNYNTLGISANTMFIKFGNYKEFLYGGAIFDQFYFFKSIILHSEFNMLNAYDFLNNKRIWTKSIYLGSGYKQKLGKHSYVTYLILWDLLYDENKIFRNPTFRISFYF